MTLGSDMERLAEALEPRNQWHIQNLGEMKGLEGDRPADGDHSAWRETGPGEIMDTVARIHASLN